MKVFISGAESTGKSWLAGQLGRHYNAVVVPEYARQYVESLNLKYGYTDVEHIAHHQIRDIDQDRSGKLTFFDTGLIISYVWFREKYGHVPDWFERVIREKGKGKYLVCDTDMPWQYDPVRENPGRREELNGFYMKLMEDFDFEYSIIKGVGDERLMSAIKIVDQWLES